MNARRLGKQDSVLWKRPWRVLAPFALAAATAVAGCGGADTGFDAAGAGPGGQAVQKRVKLIEPGKREAAPKVSGATLKGEKLALDSYAGKVVVLNFWASWCAPCRDETPILQKVYHHTRDQGVRLVGVNTMDQQANAKAFVRNFDMTYPSLYDQVGSVRLKFRGKIPQNLPTTLIIDRKGRVAGRVIGEAHREQLKRMVTKVAEQAR